MLNETTVLVILLVLGLCLIVVALAPRNAMARSVVYRLTHPVTRPAEPTQKHKSAHQPFWNIRTVAAPHTEVPVDLYVYQVDAAGKKIRAKTGLHLPKEPGQFAEILPPHGKPSAEAFESVWLADTPTVKTVSHASPLKVYMGYNSKLYLETNKQNYNPSRYNGHQVVDDVPLDDVVKTDEKGARHIFFLASEGLVFAYNTQKAKPAENDSVILDNCAFDPDNTAEDQPQITHRFAH